MKKFTKQKGITLIALIITIIVMLILVAVTINVAINGGLFERAKNAQEETQREADKEELLSYVIGSYDKFGNFDGDAFYAKLNDESTGWKVTKNANGTYTCISPKNNEFTVDKDGNITYVGKNAGTITPQQTDGSFTISSYTGSQTIDGQEIHVHAYTKDMINVNFTEQEAYQYIYSMTGVSTLSEAIEVILDMDYDEIISIIEDEMKITVSSDEDVFKIVMLGEDYENYNNYSFVDVVEEFAKDNMEYVAQNKKIRVDGQEISGDKYKIKWDGNDATFLLTKIGTHTIELELDGKTASNQVTIILGDGEKLSIEIGDFAYNLYLQTQKAVVYGLSNEGNMKIENSATELTIPDSVTYWGNEYEVTEIWGLSGKTNLILTSLPSGLTEIGDAVFQDCTNLALASLPSGITSIGNYAFKGCTNLELTSLPSGITSIGYNAFQGCTNLALAGLPSSLTSIERDTFNGCTNLALVSLPDNLTRIDDRAFYNCAKIKITSLPSTIDWVGDYAFYGCSGIEQLDVSNCDQSKIMRGGYPWGLDERIIIKPSN